ncbi:replication initiation protein [Arsenophonus nasoniae]|uniref:replication initiation protein n=1 Tax=Arsenophonus nasoniae TaxID=638 RepID=UPI0038796060
MTLDLTIAYIFYFKMSCIVLLFFYLGLIAWGCEKILKNWITVKKPHQLITSRMNLKPREQDLITLLVKSLKSEQEKLKFSGVTNENVVFEFRYHTKDLEEHFDLTRQGLYKALYDGTKVMGKVLEIKDPDNKMFSKVVIISNACFEDGVLFIRMDKDAAKYLLEYSSGFSEIDLTLLLSLRGGYEKRILELISRFKGIKDYTVSIEEFCNMLGVSPNDYVDFPRFKRATLTNPIKNIVSKSNGVWTFRSDYKDGFIIEKTGKSYKPYNKITFKLDFNESISKEKEFIFKENDNPRYAMLDMLEKKISSMEANKVEAAMFLSLCDELDISYTSDVLKKANIIKSN